jgi:hypothetical protein
VACNKAQIPFIRFHRRARESVKNPHVVGDDDDDGVVCEKGKAADGSATKRKQGVMDAFVDRGLPEEKTQGEGDTEMMGFEDITAEELEAEFNQLQLRSSDPPRGSSQAECPLLYDLTRCTTPKKLAEYGKGYSATHDGADNSRSS